MLLNINKVHNGKIEIISFVVKFRHLPALIVNFEVYVKVCSRLRCTPMPHDCNVNINGVRIKVV